ncbi:membrane-anchored junction protein isoform X2 [Rhineura floridana]|uniref:membrane-anchored junction protein isoform X2 n=1 Tax=Rhineura floridana TaxID=261503 RepID=UPI002AC87872|nr:membrane-anchored junction protein isoform X2 [Rhineura floridana]
MEAEVEGWFSEHTSLKPFIYPVPETRFLHAGVNVYKFKIKYGNSMSTNDDLYGSIVNEELQDAIRVILGNLDNLYPFTTEHFIIFPYLNKWEKVSDLRFMHGDAFLIPYPYVCTIYVELNSLKQSVLWGKAGYREPCNSDNSRSELGETVDTERTVKWRRLESTVEISHPQLYVDRNAAKNATCFYDITKPDVGFDKNQPGATECQCCGSASVNSGYENRSLWESVPYVRTKNAENRQQNQQAATMQKRSEKSTELKTKGFLELLKSTLFPPLLQRIFSGSSQLS